MAPSGLRAPAVPACGHECRWRDAGAGGAACRYDVWMREACCPEVATWKDQDPHGKDRRDRDCWIIRHRSLPQTGQIEYQILPAEIHGMNTQSYSQAEMVPVPWIYSNGVV